MIYLQDLSITVWEKTILSWVSLKFEQGKNYLLLWLNGSWKSSLSRFLMWDPSYNYISWKVEIDGQSLLDLSPNERSHKWLFLSFQSIPEITWVTLWEYLRIIYNHSLKKNQAPTPFLSPFVFARFIKKHLRDLEIDEKFLARDLNVWFSGWEKRKIELLQAKLLNPKYIIFDEIDSGLDINALKVVSQHIQEMNTPQNTLIMITHHFQIIKDIDFDTVYVLKDGKIIQQWGKQLVDEIQKNGFG